MKWLYVTPILMMNIYRKGSIDCDHLISVNMIIENRIEIDFLNMLLPPSILLLLFFHSHSN